MISRRRFLQTILVTAASAGSAFTYVRAVEPKWVEIERINLPITGLPVNLENRTLAHISDIHLSEYFSPEDLAKAVRLINNLQPDWLMLTGDFVGRNAEDAQGLVEPLREITAPMFAVLGNHDIWTRSPVVQRYLNESGATVLRNAGLLIADRLWLAGTDDMWSGHPDLQAALRDAPREATNLLMVHEPDYLDQLIEKEAPVAVQFSGHSHGGQVRLPTWRPNQTPNNSWAPILPKFGEKYPIGLNRVGNYRVYTNRGLGMWPVPYRFNCRPEITLYTLLSA